MLWISQASSPMLFDWCKTFTQWKRSASSMTVFPSEKKQVLPLFISAVDVGTVSQTNAIDIVLRHTGLGNHTSMVS